MRSSRKVFAVLIVLKLICGIFAYRESSMKSNDSEPHHLATMSAATAHSGTLHFTPTHGQ